MITAESLQTAWIQRGQDAVMNTYKRFPIVFDSGDGCTLRDIDGQAFLDFTAGIAVNALGHNHPQLVQALQAQCEKLFHCSNLYWTAPQIQLAERLTQLSGLSQAFFCNSGAEAIEAALKLARKYQHRNASTPKHHVIAMSNSFHGRTCGALSLTGQHHYQDGFAPLIPDITHVPFNDLAALKVAIKPETGAIILEPVQGEGGIHPANPDYIQAVRMLCNEHGIVLIFDEVQTGIGRTGKMFGFEHFGVKPDILALAKALGAGFPIGAIVASEKVTTGFQPGDHASTFGGNPLACTAANTILDVIEQKDLLAHVTQQGQYLHAKLTQLQQEFPEIIQSVRGVGLMQGIQCSMPVESIVAECLKHKLLVIGAGAKVLRFVPPLIVKSEEIDQACAILETVLAQIVSQQPQATGVA